jgi:methyl halide transferase
VKKMDTTNAAAVAPFRDSVCLEFPFYKDPDSAGPPWGLKGVYWDLLAEGEDGLVNESENEEKAQGHSLGQEPFIRKVYFKPPRSYENGRGTDQLSALITR